MIGGYDFVTPWSKSHTAMNAVVDIIYRYWPSAVFEDSYSDNVYKNPSEIPFAKLAEWCGYIELFAFKDLTSRDSEDGGMIYLMFGKEELGLTFEDKNLGEEITESIKSWLKANWVFG